MVIEGNCRNADFGQSKDDFKMLGAIATGNRDVVTRTDTLL